MRRETMTDVPQTHPQRVKPRKGLPKFNLSTFFLLTGLLCITLAYTTSPFQKIQRYGGGSSGGLDLNRQRKTLQLLFELLDKYEFKRVDTPTRFLKSEPIGSRAKTYRFERKYGRSTTLVFEFSFDEQPPVPGIVFTKYSISSASVLSEWLDLFNARKAREIKEIFGFDDVWFDQCSKLK
jgi:hypothetical protein